MKGTNLTYMGETTDSDSLVIYDGDIMLINSNIDDMVNSWKGSLDMTGGDD